MSFSWNELTEARLSWLRLAEALFRMAGVRGVTPAVVGATLLLLAGLARPGLALLFAGRKEFKVRVLSWLHCIPVMS